MRATNALVLAAMVSACGSDTPSGARPDASGSNNGPDPVAACETSCSNPFDTVCLHFGTILASCLQAYDGSGDRCYIDGSFCSELDRYSYVENGTTFSYCAPSPCPPPHLPP
jgi:hypothetical protein